MAFICRICKQKLISAKLVLDDVDFSVVSTLCGHLFHHKCLEGSVTNQKLSHAMTGTGPFRRYCPAAGCMQPISEHGTIEISTLSVKNLDDSNSREEDEGEEVETKLLKKIQHLSTEKERLSSEVEKLEQENEAYKEALDEVKTECDEIRALLLDDNMMNKGDRVFWVWKDGTFVSSKILEMRRKPGDGTPYAVLKLERKAKLPGEGPYKSERETAVVSVRELITFKHFFKDLFDELRSKLWKIMADVKKGKTADGRQQLLRSKFRESSLRLSIDASTVKLLPSFSACHEAVETVDQTTESYEEIQQFQTNASIDDEGKKTVTLTRARTIHLDSTKPRPRRIENKSRSVSWHHSTNMHTQIQNQAQIIYSAPLRSPTAELSFSSSISELDQFSPVFESRNNTTSDDFISVGERVIWYDTYSEFPQVGAVASVLQYTPCAIVNFDKLPNDPCKYKYRTVPLDQLFPYDLTSLEEKIKIAAIYGFDFDEYAILETPDDEIELEHEEYAIPESPNDEIELERDEYFSFDNSPTEEEDLNIEERDTFP